MTQGEKGAIIGDRYELQGDVGLGTFGRVVECWDPRRSRYVAVKVVRKASRCRDFDALPLTFEELEPEHQARPGRGLCWPPATRSGGVHRTYGGSTIVYHQYHRV